MDAIRLGRSLRALRRERGWRQRDVAGRAGVSKSTIGRLELGQLEGVTARTLERVARSLGAGLEVGLRWNGESLDRLLDRAHADLVEGLVAMLRAAGWEVAPEASFSFGGERGSIDVLASHPRTRALLVVEVKSVVPDLQALLHGLDRKARLAPLVARERGWTVAGTARLLVLGDTRTNRRRAATHAATISAALPSDGRTMAAWLRDPIPPAPSGRLFLPPAPRTGQGGGGRHRIRTRSAERSAGEPSVGAGERRRSARLSREPATDPRHGTSARSR